MAKKLYYSYKVQRQQSLRPEELKRLQSRKLRGMVRYAFKFVPYYRKTWKDSGVKVDGIRSAEDLKKLPVVDKKTVLEHYDDFVSDEYRKYLNVLPGMPSFLFMRSTSGTSGPPFKIYFNPNAKDYMDAVYARALMNVGYDPTRPMLYYWWQQAPQRELYHMLGLFKKTYVPSSWGEERQFELMQSVKPKYIYYYPSALYFISRMVLKQNIELNFKPRLIITHAELLTEKMREKIEDAFGCPVYDQYGSNEFNRIAWECKERDGYHVDSDSVVVEIVDKDHDEAGYGEVGKVIITGLVNKTMPLIRYEMGDFATKAEKEQTKHTCGLNLPVLIKSVEGRYEHSDIRRKGAITQKSMLNDILGFLDKHDDIAKFQILVNGRNRKIAVNYVVFGGKKPPIKDVGGLKLEKYRISFKRVGEIKKNNITGKTLLLERINR